MKERENKLYICDSSGVSLVERALERLQELSGKQDSLQLQMAINDLEWFLGNELYEVTEEKDHISGFGFLEGEKRK